MQPITNSQIALEFFANILFIKGIISVEMNEAILSATSMDELDIIIDELFSENSGDNI